MVPNPSSLPFS